MRHVVAALVAFGALALACSGDDEPKGAPPAPADDAGTTAPPAPGPDGGGFVASFTFGPCLDEFRGAQKCGTAKVPLDYDAPDGKTIDLFVARFGSVSATATQVYALPGGPGGSASTYLGYLSELASADVEIIAVEHRGVGRSSALACPAALEAPHFDVASQSRDCLSEVEKTWTREELAKFTTSNAARDVGVAIRSLRQPEQRAFVYGASYGTLWAHRFLQVGGVSVDGVVLDSTIDPANSNLHEFHEFADRVLRRIGAACAASADCAARLGASPYERMVSILSSANSSTCAGPPLVLGRFELADLIGAMLQQPFVNELIPSFLYRYERCSLDDQQALSRAMSTIYGASAELHAAPESDVNLPLYMNVIGAELWPVPPPNLASLEAQVNASPIPAGGSLVAGQRVEVWPTYPRDEHYGKVVATDVPVLIVNGDFDVQTPVEDARALAAKLGGAHYIELPSVNHGIVGAFTYDGASCGTSIVSEFLANPKAKPAASCVASLRPYSPVAYTEIAQQYYGTSSPWDGAPSQDAAAPRASDLLTKSRERRLPW